METKQPRKTKGAKERRLLLVNILRSKYPSGFTSKELISEVRDIQCSMTLGLIILNFEKIKEHLPNESPLSTSISGKRFMLIAEDPGYIADKLIEIERKYATHTREVREEKIQRGEIVTKDHVRKKKGWKI